MDLPPDCPIARGTYSVRPAKVGMGLVTWLCTLRATYTVAMPSPYRSPEMGRRKNAWLAFLALLIPVVGLGRTNAIIAMVAFSLLILIRNVAIGIRNVPAEVVDAARGMGMSAAQILSRVELPLALPIIVAGLRVAAVTVISVTVVAAYVNAGGLGTLIFNGIAGDHPPKIWAGALAACALAVSVDLALSAVERSLRRARA